VSRFTPVDAVARARQQGLAVYVVGFGADVDVLALNRMAMAGGTALAGCDPTGDTVAAPAKCYYQADSAAQLSAALDAISIQVSAEVCDGIDNDCDGQIDEGLERGCANGCGAGVESCQAGVWQGCTAPQPSAEVCGDGRDNDCDGTIDQGCECAPGDSRVCGNDVGACAQHRGQQRCGSDGRWGACEGAQLPMPEQCNGIDDDCNGFVDDAPVATLCPNGAVCESDGSCHSPLGGAPATGAGPAGCGCQLGGGAGGPPSSGSALLALLAGLGGWVASRRRRDGE
jgi:MYXO-CTERM domain-containing protein